MAAATVTYQSIMNALKKGECAPVLMLHGQEGYYIDSISRQVEELVPEDDRDFNLTVLYAPQTEPGAVIEACRRYPMMSERQVVILRELQTGYTGSPRMTTTAYLKALAPYVQSPTATTVLCICCRGEEAKSAEFFKSLPAGNGVNFISNKLKDTAIASTVEGLVKDMGLTIDNKALTMLCDFVGTDLSRLYNEVTKLGVSLGKGAMITPEAVERNIGISKDYNNFELIAAIATHNSLKAFEIINYFTANPKNNPVQPLAATIFNYFANLLTAWYAPDRSERGLMQALGFRWPGQLRDIKEGMKFYGPWQTVEIIGLIREFDCASKGIRSRQDPYDMLHDLIFHILNPLGASGVKI